jgi:heme A synthase
MKFDVSFFISIAAIVVMLYCLYLVLSLKRNVPGGVVGKTWGTLTALVALFTAGYFVTPFFSLLPGEIINLIVSLIFFFGAIYVVVTVRLIYRIIEELSA